MDNYTAYKLVKEYGLYVPPQFKEYSYNQISDYVGGCGPGGTGDYVVPDTAYFFVNIKPACFVHDFYYSVFMPRTIECKEESEQVFLHNMKLIVDAHHRWRWLTELRYLRVAKYAYMTDKLGWSSFLKKGEGYTWQS